MSIETAEEFVEAFGCAKCVRARRSSFARVITLCADCHVSPVMIPDWVQMKRNELAGYLTRTEAPWAAVQLPGELLYFTPEWVQVLLEAGTQVRNARKILGVTVDWPQVITAAARDTAFRQPFVSVCVLANQGMPGGRVAGARAILAYASHHGPPSLRFDGNTPG